MFGTLAATVWKTSPQLPPVEYSIFTLGMELLAVQVMGWIEPDCHVSPPLGEVTWSAGGPVEPTVIAKTPPPFVPA